jgi:hypothetical protein
VVLATFAGAVVLGVAESSPGALDVLDRGVRRFGAGVGHAGGDQDLDLGPPLADRVEQLVGFGHLRDEYVVAQAHLLVSGLVHVGAGQDPA